MPGWAAVGQEHDLRAFGNTRIGRWIRRHYDLSDTTVDRLGNILIEPKGSA